METIVHQLSSNDIKAIEEKLAPYRTSSSNQYVTFSAKHLEANLLVYTSKKCVIQGKGAADLEAFVGLKSSHQSQKTAISQNQAIIGTDEVGNGSYFGAITVVASFVTPEDHGFLKQLGVDDSKTLTDKRIREIAPILSKHIPHKALLLAPTKYNQLVGEGKDYNAVSVKVALHNQAIYLLLQEGYHPDAIVIDAFTSEKNYNKYLTRESNHFSNPVNLIEKAESQYLAVAVSSVIARAMFLENLEQLSEHVDLSLPSGAGHKSDIAASQILETYGEETLSQIAKLHFKNTEKAKTLLQRRY